jgi:hypothetical protein
MLYLENVNELKMSIDPENLVIANKDYSKTDLIYCSIKLFELGFISVYGNEIKYTMDRSFIIVISDITALGHKYLFDYHLLQESNPTRTKIKQFIASFIYDVSVGVTSTALTYALK